MKKGENFPIIKPVSGASLDEVLIGLGWDNPENVKFDVDLSAFLLNEDGKVQRNSDFVFYNSRLKREDGTIPSSCGSLVHWGDARAGSGTGNDDEKITVTLKNVPDSIVKIAFYVSIFQYKKREQVFGVGNHIYVRIVNTETNAEIRRFSLPEQFGEVPTMLFGTLYRVRKIWHFKTIGQGMDSGLARIAQEYGVGVTPQSLENDL